MTTYGLTSAGFAAKSYDEIRAEIVAELQLVFDANVDTSDDGPLGVLVSIFAERESDIWDLVEQVYLAAYRSSATGQQLADLYAMIGGEVAAATYSVVSLSLTGTGGTNVPAGSITQDGAGQSWIHASAVTIPGTTLASPSVAGPITAAAGTLTRRASPIGGWTGVTNPLDAVPGHYAQTDPEVRFAMGAAFHSGAGSSTEALYAALFRVPGVTGVIILNNRDCATDANGVPQKSYEAIVRGGTDADIASALWLGQPAGIQSWGSTSVAVIDSEGDAQTIRFTRPTDVVVYMTAEVEAYEGFDADGLALIKAVLLAQGTTQATGQAVTPWQYAQKVELDNIRNLTIKVGTAPSPTQTTPLAITVRQRALLQTATVNVVRI